eukprot:9501570-Pyramimonas_sp.AAC.1
MFGAAVGPGPPRAPEPPRCSGPLRAAPRSTPRFCAASLACEQHPHRPPRTVPSTPGRGRQRPWPSWSGPPTSLRGGWQSPRPGSAPTPVRRWRAALQQKPVPKLLPPTARPRQEQQQLLQVGTLPPCSSCLHVHHHDARGPALVDNHARDHVLYAVFVGADEHLLHCGRQTARRLMHRSDSRICCCPQYAQQRQNHSRRHPACPPAQGPWL